MLHVVAKNRDRIWILAEIEGMYSRYGECTISLPRQQYQKALTCFGASSEMGERSKGSGLKAVEVRGRTMTA